MDGNDMTKQLLTFVVVGKRGLRWDLPDFLLLLFMHSPWINLIFFIFSKTSRNQIIHLINDFCVFKFRRYCYIHYKKVFKRHFKLTDLRRNWNEIRRSVRWFFKTVVKLKNNTKIIYNNNTKIIFKKVQNGGRNNSNDNKNLKIKKIIFIHRDIYYHIIRIFEEKKEHPSGKDEPSKRKKKPR